MGCNHISSLKVSQLLLSLAFLTSVFWLYLVVTPEGDERFPSARHHPETQWSVDGLYQPMDFIPAQHENKDHKIEHNPTQSLLQMPSPTLCTGLPPAHLLLRCDRTHLNTTNCRNNVQVILQGHKAALCPSRTQTQGKKRPREKENQCCGSEERRH